MDTILKRRSIRKYKPDSVSEGDLKEILRAGMSAPSAMNAQPWHFIVINDRKTMEAITEFHPYSQMLKSAPLAILVCGDLSQEKAPGFWVQDCSAATENILLAATAKELGAVWVGVYPKTDMVESMRRLMNLPEEVIPFCIIPIGYPAEAKEYVDRYNPTKIRHDKW